MLAPEPYLLNFETATACNGGCTFCMHPKMKRRGRASWSQLLNIMYWHTPNAGEVVPFGMQEPTLEPRLSAILANCKQFNTRAKTILYSNMSHYDERVWREIIRFNTLDELHISFYGVDKRTYNLLQPNLDYYEVQRNIKRLMRLRHRMRWRKPEVGIRLIMMPETVGKAYRFMKHWSSIVDVLGLGYYDAWCGNNSYNHKFYRRRLGAPAEKRVPCNRLWGGLYIHYDGAVVPCCLDYEDSMVMGNIHEDRNTFTNAKFQELRQLHVEGRQDEVDLCRDCSYWLYEQPKDWVEYWLKQKHEPVISVAHR